MGWFGWERMEEAVSDRDGFYQGFGPTMDHDCLSEYDFCGHFEQEVGRPCRRQKQIKISKSKRRPKTPDTSPTQTPSTLNAFFLWPAHLGCILCELWFCSISAAWRIKPMADSSQVWGGELKQKDPMGMTKNDLIALVLHNGLAVLMDVSYP